MRNWEIGRFVNFVRSIDKVWARQLECVTLKEMRNAKKHLVRTPQPPKKIKKDEKCKETFGQKPPPQKKSEWKKLSGKPTCMGEGATEIYFE
jgi:hypothetical protein